MQLNIPYGDSFISANLPERTKIIKSSWMPQKLMPVKDIDEEIERTLNNPVNSKPILEMVKPGMRITIAFDDPTVLCFAPVREKVITKIVETLFNRGIKKRDIILLCAPGLHRRWTRMEIAKIIGEKLVEEFGFNVVCHDAEDKENLVYLGKTENGYDLEVNKLVVESDILIYVNTSTLRGLTGGWKSIFVGLGTYRSIRWHHSPEGLSAAVHNNPMHKILDEMGRYFESKCGKERIFKIETVLSNPFEVHRIFAGNIWDTRKEVLKILTQSAPPPSPEKYDVIIYGVPAYSPYATFAKMNPILTLFSTGLGYLGGINEKIGKKGCTTILVTPCPDEWDEIHHYAYPEVWHRCLSYTKDPWVMRDMFEEDLANRQEYIYKYRFCYSFHPVHGIMASFPLKRLKHIGNVIVAGAENPQLIRHAGFEPAETVEKAIEMAETIHGRNCTIAYIDNLPG